MLQYSEKCVLWKPGLPNIISTYKPNREWDWTAFFKGLQDVERYHEGNVHSGKCQHVRGEMVKLQSAMSSLSIKLQVFSCFLFTKN